MDSSFLVERGLYELKPAEFYHELFGHTDAYKRYGLSFRCPLILSEANGGLGTIRSGLDLLTVLELSEERSDAYIAPCTFFHGYYAQRSTHEICAFVLDIDQIDQTALERALDDWWPNGLVLAPTYVVCSGNGLHLYYALAYPVDYRHRWKAELNRLNHWLYDQYKDEYELGKLDYHPLTQSYRVVGSLTKAGDTCTTAFRVANPYTIEELAAAAGIHEVFTVENFSGGVVTGEKQARYERVAAQIKAGKKPSKKTGWNPGFYGHLAERLRERSRLYGEFGHRYKQVQALSVAAVKDRIPKEQLRADVRDIWQRWNNCAEQYHHPRIEWSECEKAMKIYDQDGDVRMFPKWWLEALCGFEFGTQKRNGRSQKEHLNRVFKFRRISSSMTISEYLSNHPNASMNECATALKMSKTTVVKNWDMACSLAGIENSRAGNHASNRTYRPTKADQIREYAREHPEANNSQIARALGVSRPTVVKWLQD